MTEQVESATQERTNQIWAAAGLLLLVIWFVVSGFNARNWAFVLWECLIPLFPFGVVGGAFVMAGWGKWYEFLGDGALMLWALSVSALAIKRAWANNLSEGFLILGVLSLILSSVIFGIAIYILKRGSPDEESKTKSLRQMSWASITITVFAFVVGLTIAGYSEVL